MATWLAHSIQNLQVWIATNPILLLLGILLSSIVCLLALACHVYGLSRRVAALADSDQKRSLTIARLQERIDAYAAEIEILQNGREASPAATNPDEVATVATEKAQAMRHEIESLISDLTTE
jgi:hypothetical protein